MPRRGGTGESYTTVLRTAARRTAAAAATGDAPARLAAQYRLQRELSLARAAMARLPPSDVAGEGLREGLAACGADAQLRARLWEALAGETVPSQSPRDAYASLRVAARLS